MGKIEKTKPLSLRVYTSNAMITGRQNYSLIERRIMYGITRRCREVYVENKNTQKTLFDDLVINISIDDLLRSETNIKRIYEAARRMRLKEVEVDTPEFYLCVGFINYVKHIKHESFIEIEVSKEILPYLVELSGAYTVFELTVAITLKSVYTQRFYELCSRWKNRGFFFYPIQKLREMMSCEDKFKTYGEFKRDVIDIAQRELKQSYDDGVSDIYFTYRVKEKTKTKVEELHFDIINKNDKQTPSHSVDDLLHFIKTQFMFYFPNDKNYVERVIEACKKDYLIADGIAIKLKEKNAKYSFSEMPSILRYILSEDFDLK
jgi:plasmid replication initiation protein